MAAPIVPATAKVAAQDHLPLPQSRRPRVARRGGGTIRLGLRHAIEDVRVYLSLRRPHAAGPETAQPRGMGGG